jgi:hypothetical protein
MVRFRRAEALSGDDARPVYRSALEDFTEAIRINPAAKTRIGGPMDRAARRAGP